MVHIDPATLRRHPIIGVLLGGVTAIFIGFLLQSGMGEARALLAQKTPDHLSLHETVNLRGTRWVTVSEGQWNCDRIYTRERRPGLECWVLGAVETTEIPIVGTVDGEILVASFDGAVRCGERAGSPVTGVVGSTEIFTSRAALHRWSGGGARVAVLNVGASPREALIMAIGLFAIMALGLGVAAYYLRIMFPPGGRHAEPLPTQGAIQPR